MCADFTDFKADYLKVYKLHFRASDQCPKEGIMIPLKKVQKKSKAAKHENSEKRLKNNGKCPLKKTTSAISDTLNRRVDVNRIRNRKSSCPEILLHNTGLTGKELPELFKLIKIGEADIQSLATKGIFPLHEAVSKGLTDCAKELIEKATTINVRNAEGFSPLDIAVETGNFECAELLIRHGASTEGIRHGFKSKSRTIRKVSSST